ncbi:hypothetical protein KP509_22G028400 [Ceratopteris richardii]|uniref:Myb/SANT-like DNA-binding domain-containing protein n=1 Tax=Ceratopteris richardii TaxID=49495 RepID=A0A8T2S6V8_CERRI|nr:hypothetical protein KP509_22G028400 [Ceratopteris richardii]
MKALHGTSAIANAHTGAGELKLQEPQIPNPLIRGSKRSRGVLWDDSHTFTLIKCFEDVYVHIKRGNLRLKDWEQVVNSLNKECGLSFSCDQVRNRIDTLKKQHKKESTKQNSTGSTPSTWKFYDACESLWGSSPKCIGISGAFDSDGRQSSQGNAVEEEPPIEIDDTVQEQASQTTKGLGGENDYATGSRSNKESRDTRKSLSRVIKVYE